MVEKTVAVFVFLRFLSCFFQLVDFMKSVTIGGSTAEVEELYSVVMMIWFVYCGDFGRSRCSDTHLRLHDHLITSVTAYFGPGWE